MNNYQYINNKIKIKKFVNCEINQEITSESEISFQFQNTSETSSQKLYNLESIIIKNDEPIMTSTSFKLQ